MLMDKKMDLTRWFSIMVLCLAALLTGCSSVPEDEESTVNDPFEGMNRTFWTLNYEYLDPYLVRPVALTYVEYTPVPVRKGIANALANLDEPSSMVNNILMGNGEKAVTHFNRFWINSTFGLLGLFDIASAAGIVYEEDKEFGDVVGHYGVGNGPYFMIPGYGPYTLRETTNTVDGLYAPLYYLNFWASLGKWALEGLESRAAFDSQKSQLDNSADPYGLARDIYLQRKDYKAEIHQDEYDEEEEDFLDSYLDEEF